MQPSGFLCLSNVIANYVLAYVVAADSFLLCNVKLWGYNTSYFFRFVLRDIWIVSSLFLSINTNLSPNGVQLLEFWGHGIC